MDLKDIFRIEDANDFVVGLNDYISEKCQYGDDMGALSAPERVFYVAQTLEMEVNNGGFLQFFGNSSGEFAGEVVAVFQSIGAHRTAEICQRALTALRGELPADREERDDFLDELDDEINETLSECDDEFYEYEDDLNELNRAYVLKNRDSFK